MNKLLGHSIAHIAIIRAIRTNQKQIGQLKIVEPLSECPLEQDRRSGLTATIRLLKKAGQQGRSK
ncbi:MAG TPA: hypothetical protein DCQ20_08680 [Nitrospira sp.]|nr:hypothetical protein [Nitrospira sp.]